MIFDIILTMRSLYIYCKYLICLDSINVHIFQVHVHAYYLTPNYLLVGQIIKTYWYFRN